MSDEEETVFTISIPLHLLPLQVSIPLQIFSVGPVPNLASLQRRVESLSVFPACWVTIPCERVLMFMKVSCMEQEVQVDFNLQVTEDFTWTGPPLWWEKIEEHENVRRKNERLKKRLALYCDGDGGVEVDDTLHQDLKVIMQENSSKFSLSPDSFEKVFWEQQEQAASVQKASLMRWHPLMIKWCLYLRHLSGSAYELLHNLGLKFPSQRTLRDYSYISPTSIGFSNQVDQQLMEAANIAEYLVFDKHSGELLCYINLGETNNQLLDLERLVSDDQNQELASSIIIIMVRGPFTRLCFPYAQFSASTLSGDLLYDPIWEAVSRIEFCGFKVLAITADGASSNRRFFKLHDPTAKFLHKTLNTHDPDRYIFFFSDPPHLIKTTRNCWSRCKLVVELLGGIYLADNDPSKTSPGLRLVPKLKSTFLSERLCQDPLEQFFGCQRQRGRTNDNPTVKEFCKNTQALRVVNSLCAGIVKGNCRGKRHANRSISEMDLRPLAKRPRTKSCT
ncbi:hypothetical protein EMCRGX_G013484 [Ephydatia muelleri]